MDVTNPRIYKELNNAPANFERAILLTGYGRYHLWLLFVCGITTMAVGFQNGVSAYILPSAECDLNLSSGEMGLLNAALLIGSSTSALLWGAVADAIGRKNVLIWTLVMDGTLTFLSSFSQSFSSLFFFRFLNGFVIGAPGTIILTFIGEFHPEKTRATAICYLGIFWTISWIILPVSAWMIIPFDFLMFVYGFKLNSWRLFVGIFALPSLISAILLSKYPETPKFLMSQGKNKEALHIMRQMFASNNNLDTHLYPITCLVPDTPSTKNTDSPMLNTLKKMWKQLCQILRPPFLKYTILCSTIMFTNMFGFYGLGLWLPKLFNSFEIYYHSHPNATITVCELAYLRPEHETILPDMISSQLNITSNLTSQLTHQPDIEIVMKTCRGSVDPKVFVNTITIGFACLIGNLASSYLADRLDHRVMPVVTMIIPGVCGCFIYFLQTATQNLIIACLFSSFISIASMVILSIIVDVFPTNVNAMAVCTSCFAGRLGAIISNILFGLLLDISCEVPIFLVGGIVILGGLLGVFLPKKVIGDPPADDSSDDTFVISQ